MIDIQQMLQGYQPSSNQAAQDYHAALGLAQLISANAMDAADIAKSASTSYGLNDSTLQWLSDRGLAAPENNAVTLNVDMSQYWTPGASPDLQWQSAVKGLTDRVYPASSTRPSITTQEYTNMSPIQQAYFARSVNEWDRNYITNQRQLLANRAFDERSTARSLPQMDKTLLNADLPTDYNNYRNASDVKKWLSDRFVQLYPEYNNAGIRNGWTTSYNGANIAGWGSKLNELYDQQVTQKYQNWEDTVSKPSFYGLTLDEYNSQVRDDEAAYLKNVTNWDRSGTIPLTDQQQKYIIAQDGQGMLNNIKETLQRQASFYDQQIADQKAAKLAPKTPAPTALPASVLGAPLMELPGGSQSSSYNTALAQLMNNTYSSPNLNYSYTPASGGNIYNPYGYQIPGYSGGAIGAYFGQQGFTPSSGPSHSFNMVG